MTQRPVFFWLLYLQHGITNYNYIGPILKHNFQKLIQKHICTVRCKKREYMRMLKPSTSISLRHVQLCKTM
jgi:hypothetical protein